MHAWHGYPSSKCYIRDQQKFSISSNYITCLNPSCFRFFLSITTNPMKLFICFFWHPMNYSGQGESWMHWISLVCRGRVTLGLIIWSVSLTNDPSTWLHLINNQPWLNELQGCQRESEAEQHRSSRIDYGSLLLLHTRYFLVERTRNHYHEKLSFAENPK